MYLSCLLIDTGTNPDRPRPGRLWLRNLYHVHQRLCMAFPSTSRKANDAEFLKPFQAEDFGHGHVHVNRETTAGFLFRIDPQPGDSVAILVQSALKPDWDYAFHNAGYLLAAPPEIKKFDPKFAQGQFLRFRLVANPTKKLKDEQRHNGKRVPVPADKLLEWFKNKAETAGFAIPSIRDENDKETNPVIQPGYIYFRKPQSEKENQSPTDTGKNGKDHGQRLFSVRFDGILTVTDPALFQKTLVAGIGSGKAFGFGLLSVVPDNSEVLKK